MTFRSFRRVITDFELHYNAEKEAGKALFSAKTQKTSTLANFKHATTTQVQNMQLTKLEHIKQFLHMDCQLFSKSQAAVRKSTI